jgi:exopolysaccharide biosynthesis polyprenyl glycosylphosphotransferase
MESQLTSSLPLQVAVYRASAGKAQFGWNISWLPAITLFLSDLLSWPALFLLVSQLRDTYFGSPGQVTWQVLVLPAIISAVILHLVRGYDRRTRMLSVEYAIEHLLGLSIALVISALTVYGFVSFGELVKTSRLVLFVNFGLFAAYTIACRRWLCATLRTHHSRRNFRLIADPKAAASFYQMYKSRGMLQELKIYTSDSQHIDLPILDESGPRFAGDIEQALTGLDQDSDGLIIGIHPSELDPKLAQLLAYVHFRHIPVYTLESFHEVHWQQVPAQNIEAWWAFARESLLTRDSIYDQVKRVCDLAIALVALLLLSPLLLLVGILIKLDSPGAAIFRQTRVGRDGRPFTLYKFRSMRVGSDSGPIYTAKKDSRITRLGHFLRRTRIDELPQLFNVVRGDMSIIGPRAEWIKCVERYDGQIPFYSYRHLVRPGITGWAQVNYSYGENDADALEKLKFDLYYIRYYSLSLDVAITLKTLHTMLFARGR